MAGCSRGLLGRPFVFSNYQCPRCRAFTTRSSVWSGHSRWSTIKHDKGKNDAAKTKQRNVLSQELMQASKSFGADPTTNPRLAGVITAAKKAGFPKASIEAAISRGQGRSPSGAALESLTIEAILPPSIALIIECETDSKTRTLQDLRLLIKNHGGSPTPTNYLFDKKGRILFQRKDGFGVDEILDEAVENGALDVEIDDEGRILIYTQPSATKTTADALADKMGLQIQYSDIKWVPKDDTVVGLDSDRVIKDLIAFVEEVQDHSSVQGVYMNAAQGKVPDEAWMDLQNRIAV
ncbi:MAG: hypothetical protein M1812_003790 [Candelaria pacifica]|nr:MAG: hypothetical protein M1812_003790 [Candelaria pacifica]